jgi:hypothetical protein
MQAYYRPSLRCLRKRFPQASKLQILEIAKGLALDFRIQKYDAPRREIQMRLHRDSTAYQGSSHAVRGIMIPSDNVNRCARLKKEFPQSFIGID